MLRTSLPAGRMSTLLKRLAPWLRLASEYTAAHIAARLLAAMSGLLLVRLLPVNEYGFYTLVLAAFTFVCTFSDLGATETLSFFRRRASKRNKSWLSYFHAVMRFRRTVFVFGFVSSAVYIFYTGRHLGEGMQTIIVAIILMGLAAWFAIQSGIISYVLKLEQRFRQAYAVELSNEGAKLLAVGMIWALSLTTALWGMAGVAMGALVAAILASHFSGSHLAKTAEYKPATDSPKQSLVAWADHADPPRYHLFHAARSLDRMACRQLRLRSERCRSRGIGPPRCIDWCDHRVYQHGIRSAPGRDQ